MDISTPPTSSARRRHAGRSGRAVRVGLVAAVVAVTATVGVGTWVLGSGADAAPREDPTPSSASTVGGSQPPLTVAPPPEGKPQRASRTAPRVPTLHSSVG